MPERFVDLSHHNAVVNLAAYKKAGHTRVALKATEGTGFTDPTFVARWKQAGSVGLSRGAYHFMRTLESGGAAQADAFLRVVAAAGGLSDRDWLMLDAEDDKPGARDRAGQFAADFCARMTARGHDVGLIYTRTNYAGPARITSGRVPAGWRRLWLANYRSGEADAVIDLPAGWTRAQVAARQYTDRATVPGIGGPADYSRVLADWLTPTSDVRDEDDMVIITAPHRPWLAYYPVSGVARVIGPGEQGPLQAAHKATSDPAKSIQVTADEFDLLVKYLDRGVRGAIPGMAALAGQLGALTSAVATGAGVDPAAITAAAQAGTEAALHEALAAGADATEPTP